MSKTMIKRPYDNATTVADEDAILADFQQRSRESYQSHPCIVDQHYAKSSVRAVFDLFACQDAHRTVIFIHGGYWQFCSKSDFSYLAPPLLACQTQCILLEYPLAPTVNIGQIVEHIQQGLDYLQHSDLLKGKVILVGHSAGAHLAAMHLNHPSIDHFILISGIYDLGPIQATHLNQALDLSEADIAQYSPIFKQPKLNAPCQIIYGDQELEELKQQSQRYYEYLKQNNCDVAVFEIKDSNHYNILDHFLVNKTTV